MSRFVFDLQRFDAQIISAGETFTLDGVTYTAVDGDAQLNLDDGKVSGLASGKVIATVTGAENSPAVTFDATDGAITFTATSDGKVISTTPFPIEFIGGEFTYKGGRIDITAGSDMSISTVRDGFTLRNENHFATDSAYIFTATSLTSESEHVVSKFILTNGTETRALNLEQLGTVINNFAESGFTLAKGSSEVLNMGDYKLTATATDADAGLNMELGENGLTFVPNTGDGKLTVALSRSGKTIFGGVLECTSGSITLGYNHEVTFAKDTSFNFTTPNNSVLTVTADDEATTAIELTDNGITFTPGSGDGKLNLALTKKGTQVFKGSLNITDGMITFDTNEKKFSFSDGTKIALGIFGLELDIEVVGDTTVGEGSGTSFGIEADENGNLIFTPDETGGSFNIALKRDSATLLQSTLMTIDSETDDDNDLETFFENNVTVKGEFMLNPETDLLTLTDGTTVSFAFKEYTVTATADGDAASIIDLTEEGISITPQTDDEGKLKLALGSADGSMSVDVEVLSGGFVFGQSGAFNVVEGTELQIKFSDDYIVNFKTTDAAGGSISLGSDGLTFKPNAEDGGLELSVTRDGVTRKASLDVTGSLTYKLDGSISLAEGTVVKNVFEDGNILTITANTDASGSIIFNPTTGLTVTPTTEDALTVALTTGDLDVAQFSSITGSINYSGGIVTASDGAQADLLIYGEWATKLSTSGGTASLQFTADRTVYTANEGATLVLDYLDGSTVEIQNGTFSDIYATETEDAIELISEGSTFRANDDEFIFTLEKAGNYTLNGTNVTTTKDGVQVVLSDYEMIIVDGLVYQSTGDENATITLGEDGSTLTGGNVNIYLEETESALNVDATNGSMTFDAATNKFSFAEGTILSMPINSNLVQFVVKEDFSVGVEKTEEEYVVDFKLDDPAKLEIINGTRKATAEFTGGLVYETGGSLTLDDGTEINLTWDDGNSLKLTSSGSTGSIAFDDDKGIQITSDDENLDLELTMAYGYSTKVSGLNGSLWYKDGTATIEEGTTLKGTGTLGGNAVTVTLETIDGDGYLDFSTANGFTYGAGTGKLKVTYALGDLESTFVVNSGSVLIGNNNSKIAEGTDLETDLKDFIPALSFTTSEAGNYTINGQTITTSAANLAMTATDDYISFKTSGDVVEYEGMTFAGNGNVSLKADNVVLGAGVEATGFGEGNSFVLAEAGNVTADAKVFELTELDTEIKIPMEITVTGAQDGFIFSRTLTKESEAYLDDALNEEDFGNYSSSYIGKVFSEKFISAGDSSYRIRTDAIGLEDVIGISDGATITGGASLADEPTLSYYNLVTDTTGKFTIGEKVYNVSGDSSVAITARFEEDGSAYASKVASLNGTIGGDFTGGTVSINGNSGIKIFNDTDVSFAADESGLEISEFDAGAKLLVLAADTYTVNGTEVATNIPGFIVGTEDGSAQLYTLPTALADFMLHKTEAGYPQMAALAFHPDEENPDAPTNYYSAEKWTTTSTDKLELSAIHYSPENPTGKWVILVHGYGKIGAAMNAFAEPYLEQGMDVLIIDQRAAGDSEGDWLTMGVAEANDLAIWTQEIAKTNANAQITLHGVSMGAATVMLCAALPETVNVSAIIEDCGYGNIADVFAALMYAYGSALGVSGVDLNELFGEVGEVAKILDGGYDIAGAAPIDSIAAVTVPSLFIHGADDAVIPNTVASALYEASGAANKTTLIVEGAGHATSIELDSDAYFTAVRNLIDSSTTEIGALIDSDADNKLLRGTIYNDTITNSGMSVTIDAGNGNDYIANDVDSSVTAAEFGNSISAGNGDDTIYNHHSYNPTLEGGAGDDSIVVSRGHLTYIDGGEGNDSIIGRTVGTLESGDWAMGGYATILGGDGDDYINPDYTNDSSIDGGNGDDTIITSGINSTVNGGAGANLIQLSGGSINVVLSGDTTVEGFNTGFGEGSDTIYIDGDPAGVEFKDGVLAFGNSTDSLTLSDVTTTAKVNIYHERRQVLNKGVFIAGGDWYSVEDSDLTVNAGEEVYFVGTAAEPKAGVDFSGITEDLNITIDTEYEIPDTSMWINGVYSLKGGAGLTTITGSDKSDTIISGDGSTTIDGAAGDDLISLSSAQALINYTAGGGDDTIFGFTENDTLNILAKGWTSHSSGDDLLITLQDAKGSQIDGSILIKDGRQKLLHITTGESGTSTEELIESIIADYSEDEIVTMASGGTSSINLAKEDYDLAVISADATGKKNISLGGGNVVIVEDTGAKVSITASKGDDSIVSEGDNVSIKFGGGATEVFATSGKITLENYDASTGAGFHTDSDILEAVDFDRNKFTLDSAVMTFAEGADAKIVNIFDADGELHKIGFAVADASLNASNEKKDLILIGDSGSTMTGGKGDDTIFANEGAIVDGGEGRNYIYLTTDNAEGSKIVLRSGKSTIENFQAGFEDTSDRLFTGVNDTVDFKFDGTDLKFYNNGKLRGVVSDISDGASFVNVLAEDANSTVKVVAAQKNEVITVDDELADYYVGNKSGVDFTNYDETLTINLGSEETSLGGGKVLFSGINQITVGGGLNTLISSSANETLTGNSEGITEFVFNAGGGRDVIRNFNFEEDRINVGSNVITNVVLNKSGGVRLEMGEDRLTLEDAQGKNFRINEFTAKVDTNLEYDDATNYYVASSRNATLTVGEEAEIWLDGSHGKYFVGDIKTLDATNSDGRNILAGNDLNNTILAGGGNASLWGGNGGDDLLVGGEGTNLFFYTNGNGNDTINGIKDGDVVYLSAVTLENLASTEFNSGAVTINFKDGGKLTINDGGADVGIVLGDQTYYVDSERKDFVTEK